MENTNLHNYNWDTILRFRLIEIITLWEGRLTSKHLTSVFGLSRSVASKVINQYNKEVVKDNLVYDKKLKGYKPATKFSPHFSTGNISEYLNLVNLYNDLENNLAPLTLEQSNIEIVNPLARAIQPSLIRPILSACRDHQRIEIEYSSLTSEKDYRNIAPHTIVFSGYRWHVRAYCEKSGQFRDFVLSRITDIYDTVGISKNTIAYDKNWNKLIHIIIKPDSRLNPLQQKVISTDYGMQDNQLIIPVRGAMVNYLLQFLRINTEVIQADPKAQQVVIENLDEVKKWLF